MTFPKSFAAFKRDRVLQVVMKKRLEMDEKIAEAKTFYINREIEKSKFWNKWTLGLMKVKSQSDLKDIYSLLSMAECWFYSDLISSRNYYIHILNMTLSCDGDVVYLSTDDAKIFVGE